MDRDRLAALVRVVDAIELHDPELEFDVRVTALVGRELAARLEHRRNDCLGWVVSPVHSEGHAGYGFASAEEVADHFLRLAGGAEPEEEEEITPEPWLLATAAEVRAGTHPRERTAEVIEGMAEIIARLMLEVRALTAALARSKGGRE